MPGEVDRLQVKIEADAQQAFKNVDSLIGRLRELARTAGTAAYAFQRLGGGFSSMGREAKGLNSSFSEVGKQAKGMGDSLTFADKRLAEMAVYSQATFVQVAKLRAGLEKYANGASAVKTTSDMASRGIASVGNAAKSAFSAIAKIGSAGLNFLGKAIGGATKRLLGFFRGIVRIAKYRAIRAALRAITDGLKVGTENLYLWSQAYNTSFAPTMDRLSTSMLYLKNGFAAMFSPLIEYFAPFIEAFVDKLVDAFNWVQRLFAQLTGKSTWNKAVKVQTKYKESTESTAKSVKALRQELQLMDFDELNNITESPDNGSPAAEAAKTEPDPTKMFTLEPTDLEPMEGTLWENIKTKLIGWLEERGLWNENGFDWKRLGNIIGTWIHDLWDNFAKWWSNIDWKNDVFKPLADFLEGLLSGLFPEQYQKWQESKKAAELHNETEDMIHEIEGNKNWSNNEGEGSPVLQREFSQLQSDIEKLIAQRRKLLDNSKTVENETALNDEISRWAKIHQYKNVPSADELFADYMRGDEHAENAYLDLPLFRAYAIGMEEANEVADKIKELQEVQSEIAQKYLGKPDEEDGGWISFKDINFDRVDDDINNLLDTVFDKGNIVGALRGMDAKVSGWIDRILASNTFLQKIRHATNPLAGFFGNQGKAGKFAAGGYPSVGTMFVAGEAGAEFVGNINGRTGVVGGREISGIGDAVWSTGGTTASLLAELISVMRNKEFTVSPSASLGKVVARSQRLYATQTG